MNIEINFHYDLGKKAIDDLIESLDNEDLENVRNIVKTMDSVQLIYFYPLQLATIEKIS